LDVADLTWFCRCLGNSEPIPLIDSSTPLHACVLKTAQDIAYGLVFSDEFTQNGRSFSAGTLLVPSFIINLLPPIISDHDLIWEAASSSDSDVYDPSQIKTKDGSLSVRLDNLQPQVQDRHQGRCDENGCTGDQVREPGLGGWKGGDGRSAIYTDRSLSGILKMKVPLCLSRGGLVEVGLGKKDFRLGSGLKRGVGKENESTLRRLIYVRLLSSFLFFSSLLPSWFLLFTHLSYPWNFIVARQFRFMVFIQPKRKPKYPS
jgi:hypothetical protein